MNPEDGPVGYSGAGFASHPETVHSLARYLGVDPVDARTLLGDPGKLAMRLRSHAGTEYRALAAITDGAAAALQMDLRAYLDVAEKRLKLLYQAGLPEPEPELRADFTGYDETHPARPRSCVRCGAPVAINRDRCYPDCGPQQREGDHCSKPGCGCY